MTPKEKAKELAIKFCSPSDIVKPNIGSCRSALIAVDEILNKDGYNNDYWQEVKQEIEKL